MFLKRAPWSSEMSSFSSRLLIGARKRLITSSPCCQLSRASSQFCLSHSTSPSFLHFCAYSSTAFSPVMSMVTRPRSLSSILLLSRTAPFIFSTSASASSCIRVAACSPPLSSCWRALCNPSMMSALSTNSSKGSPDCFAWLYTVQSKDSTGLYLSIGATSLFTCMLQFSSNSATSSRDLFISSTWPAWYSHRLLRSFRHSSRRSSTLAQGALAASFQYS
mmetsp:Transcript_63440/g.138137  ORF Transcript_63440/g.138137 Transcript_63440/m.138137 type:complete len:220 (-) Transcript_63440:405-1064(-)